MRALRTASGESVGEPRARLDLGRRAFLKFLGVGAGVLGGMPLWTALRADEGLDTREPLFPAPEDPAAWPAYREALDAWRERARAELAYDGSLYDRPEFGWAARCFSCAFLMACDEEFYDARAGRYRVADWVAAGRREFGGYDAVVLWHAYPRIGLDDRNQFDYYRDMPGGILGVREVVRHFHREGVRVFLDYNPWDTGTRRESRSDLETLALMVQALEVDGIFLDTMDRGGAAYREHLDRARPGVVLEGEIALPVDRIHDHHLSWAQWFQDSRVPGVLRNKWFERRHLQHQIRRWDTDHTGELHSAWMNGSGMMIWENVFGSWNGWCPRDRSMLRSMLPIQRRYADLFTGEGWVPLVPTLQPDVFASYWEGRGLKLYTLVNRSEREIRGELLVASLAAGERAYDLVAGRHLATGTRARGPAGLLRPRFLGVHLGSQLQPRGIGALLVGTDAALGKGFDAFLRSQRAVERRADTSTQAAPRPTRVRSAPAVKLRRGVPGGMVAIPPASLVLTTEMRVRECGFYEGTPSAGHTLGDSYRRRLQAFRRDVTLGAYAIDRTPVTNAQFALFLRATGYRPEHAANFLKHWGHGHPPAGAEDHPVVWVHLEDARAYAAWAGKRLPTEEEWQYAAQGPVELKYPWGNAMETGRCNDGSLGLGTTAVEAFPQGASPWGVWDLCGNVWEWTESERSDGRTRFCMLKGGAYYTAQGSGWYFDGGPQPNAYSAKCLLFGPGLDRSATVGFRCAVGLRNP